MATFSYRPRLGHTLQLHEPEAFQSGLHSQLFGLFFFFFFWMIFTSQCFAGVNVRQLTVASTTSLPCFGPDLAFLVLTPWQLVKGLQDVACRCTARGGALWRSYMPFLQSKIRAIKSRSVTRMQKVAEWKPRQSAGWYALTFKHISSLPNEVWITMRCDNRTRERKKRRWLHLTYFIGIR